MAVQKYRNREFPGGDIRTHPEKAKRLWRKPLSEREERPHFWSRRRDLSVPGRKAVRLSYRGEKDKGTISDLERSHLRKTISRAIRRTQKDVDALSKVLEAAQRTGKVKLPRDMARDVENWFGVSEKQIEINHIGEMHNRMSQIAGLLTHPKFEININENSEGNTVKRKLLTKASQKISIELTRENAFNPKHDISALITAVAINGANMLDDREAQQYGIPGTYSQAAFKASSYARFSESRQTAYERNWQAQLEKARRKEQDLYIQQKVEAYHVQAPYLDTAERKEREDDIIRTMRDAHQGRQEIKEVTPTTAANFQKGIASLGSDVVSRSEAEYEAAARAWLEGASGVKSNSVETLVNTPKADDLSPTDVRTQGPREEVRRKPTPDQLQAEKYRQHNDASILKQVDELKNSASSLTAEDIKLFSATLKKEMGAVFHYDHMSKKAYADAYRDLVELEKSSAPAEPDTPAKKALPGSSFGSSPEDAVDPDVVAMDTESIKGGIAREDTLVNPTDETIVAGREDRATGIKKDATTLEERNREDERKLTHAVA